MLNYEVFNNETQPSQSQIRDFVGTELITDLDIHLRAYKIEPKYYYINKHFR